MDERHEQHKQDVEDLKLDQHQTQKKAGEVENAVHGCTQNILVQMQAMMNNMQKESAKQIDALQSTVAKSSADWKLEFEKRVNALEADREGTKRHKTDNSA